MARTVSRTSHAAVVARWLAEDEEQRERALEALLPLQRWDFTNLKMGIFGVSPFEPLDVKGVGRRD